MKTISGKQLGRALERQGWELKRVTGSHHVYGKEGCPERISIPVHRNQPLKIGLLRHFMRVAKLDEADL